MTSSPRKGAGSFSAFRRAGAAQEALVQERHSATSEGRQVLALEMIADQLGAIARLLGAEQSRSADRAPEPQTTDDGGRGNSFEHAEQLPQGIERRWVETFTVGAYHYTHLDDALAEARRSGSVSA